MTDTNDRHEGMLERMTANSDDDSIEVITGPGPGPDAGEMAEGDDER